MTEATGPILLYDGVCNLCNGFVRFVLARDPAARFRFAAIQSEPGRRLLTERGLDPDALDTVVLLDERGRARTRSDAVLAVLARLRAPWPLAAAFRVVPAFVRDPVYRAIARARYRWFGRTDSCPAPTPELRGRFLDDAGPAAG
jgi:predicted DCC family thiol-disulfide oxidoreductase YuxK